MNARRSALAALATLLVASTAWAQVTVQTMFGPRQYGGYSQPRTNQYRGATPHIVYGPSGEFLGPGSRVGTMMFNGMPWQSPNFGQISQPLTPIPYQATNTSILQPTTSIRQNILDQAAAAATPVSSQDQPLTPYPLNPQGTTPNPNAPAGNQAVPEQGAPQPTAPGQDQWLRNPAGMPAPGAQIPGAQAPSATQGTNVVPGAAAPVAPVAPARTTPLPPPVQVGFAVPRTAQPPAVAVAQVLTRADRIQKVSPIQVSVENGVAVLRGRVASEDDRTLAGIIASMQPGIGDVRNELEVGSAGARISTGAARR